MRSVCFVSPTFYLNTVGGAEVQLYFMAKALAELGTYRVTYATTDILESRSVDGLSIVRIPGSPDGRSCTFEEFSASLDSVAPDVVIQLGRKQFTYYAAQYCSRSAIAFLFSTASDIDCRPLREFPRFFGEYPAKRGRNPATLARSLAMDIRTLRGMKQASCLIAQTRRQQERLRKLCRKEPVVFQNLHEVPDDGHIVKDEPPMVLWLASIKSVKRPMLFLDIARCLRGRGYRVVMAGRMDEERYRADIETAEREGCINYVECVSFARSNELIARAKVFVLTSRHEGLPNTLIQAWLRRTPTVSLGVDPDGMIKEKGLGATASTVDEAAQSIIDLLSDPVKHELTADAARSVAIERFGKEAQARRLNHIIEAALNEE